MSTSTTSGSTVNLPAGVNIGPGRETSQVNAQGQVVQGMVFPITLSNGTTTTVFVPYSLIENTAAVEQLFQARVSALTAING